jgi:dTDP-4-dehydrorhamnose reductase
MSRPDDCLKHPDLAYQMNVVATRYLVQAYNKYGVSAGHFIYVSTDFVFGNGGPHAEDATFNPLNYYGSTKWQAEQEMNNFNGLQTIIRPVFIYGQAWSGIRPGFIQWVANSVTAGVRIKVVNDQFRTPTYAPDICHAVHVIIEKKAEGAFHLAGFEVMTPYDLALAVSTLFGGHQGLVNPVGSGSFSDTVERPTSGGLLSHKAASILNFKPTLLTEGLEMSLAPYLSGI